MWDCSFGSVIPSGSRTVRLLSRLKGFDEGALFAKSEEYKDSRLNSKKCLANCVCLPDNENGDLLLGEINFTCSYY